MMEWTRFYPDRETNRPAVDGEYMIAAATRQGFGPVIRATAIWRKGEWVIPRESRQLGLYAHVITHFTSLPSLPAGPILESVTMTGGHYFANWGPEVDAFPESSIIRDPGGETDE